VADKAGEAVQSAVEKVIQTVTGSSDMGSIANTAAFGGTANGNPASSPYPAYVAIGLSALVILIGIGIFLRMRYLHLKDMQAPPSADEEPVHTQFPVVSQDEIEKSLTQPDHPGEAQPPEDENQPPAA